MKNPFLAVMICVAAISSGCATPSEQPTASAKPQVATPACEDFLAALGKKPAGVEFKGCKEENLHQLKALKAEYTVTGKDARAVEAALIVDFKLKPLKFACCGWETRPANFVGPNGEHYDINMFSGETTKKEWKAIEAFHVEVYRLLELP